jgi:hypothetical protein
LSEGGDFPCRPQFRPKSGIFRGVSRFFHCSNYRNMIECSQIRNTIVLTLPNDWRITHAGAVVVQLLRQLPEVPLQTTFAANMIAASLEMAIAGIFHGDAAPPLSERISDFTWHIRDCTYTYLPEIDDSALRRTVELASCSSSLTLIASPRHEDVLRAACESTLGFRRPMVFGLDSFISLRTIFSSWDLRWPYDRVVLDLLRRANRRALDARCDESVLVHIRGTKERGTAKR